MSEPISPPAPEPASRPRARRVPPLRIALALLAVAAVGAIVWLIWRPRPEERDVLTGYIQADNLYLSSPIAGPVSAVMVVRGQRVAAGAPLFTMDVRTLAAGRDLAGAKIAQGRSQIAQQGAALARAHAQLSGAQAQARDALDDLTRNLAVERDKPGAVSRQQIDAARAAAATALAQRDAAAHDIEGEAAQIAAAKAQAAQDSAGLVQAQTQLDQLSQRAPAAGRIEEVMFQVGEWAGANQPVVALIPDAKVKVRFYVPEGELGRYAFGRDVRFSCDGCAKGMTARIDFVGQTPEYTPPIIYSLKNRAKLVFMVEAAPASPEGLSPGQPVDVEPMGDGAKTRAR